MALLYLNAGQTFRTVGAGERTTVTGTNGNETVFLSGDADAEFEGSFNRGGDTINIDGNAGSYTATLAGNFLILTSATGATSGADIRIPIGVLTGASIVFADDAEGRVLSANAAGTIITLGGQTISQSGPTQITPGTDISDEEIFLTPDQDTVNGTSAGDHFIADFVQTGGLQVNTLGTGDRVTGGAGLDDLYAQITRGATFDSNGGIGGINGGSNTPIQPRLNGVEDVRLEAIQADLATKAPYGLSYGDIGGSLDEFSFFSNNTEVYFDAGDVRGHNEIWSWESDANLTVQDLTTIVTNGGHDDARNTSDITVGMGYTSGQDTFWDSSDFKVFFDQDFLLTGQASQSQANYFLLDEEAELIGGPRLDNINVDGLLFTVNGGPVIALRDSDALNGNDHAGFVAALQDALQDLIDDGIVPEDTQLFVDPSITDTTGLDDGSISGPIPAIVLKTNTDAVITPVGFSIPPNLPGEFDVYGVFNDSSDVEDLPLSVNISLEKVGRGGEGGDLIVGSMDKYNHGIDVFDVTVFGDDSRPSWLDYLNSTGDSESGIGEQGELDVINIVSDNSGFPDPDTYASLTIGETNDSLTLIDAQEFLGDLTLGNLDDVDDLATLLATGGGDVEFYGYINGQEPGQYVYQTGDGDDLIDLDIDGSSLEYAQSGLNISTGGGADEVFVSYGYNESELPNHIILDNVQINTGDGDDIVNTVGEGRFRINTGSGNDVIYSEQSVYYEDDYSMEDNNSDAAHWVFNVDRGDYADEGGPATDGFPAAELDSLPGVPLTFSLLAGATVTVTFSGAGNLNTYPNGGGGVGEQYGTDNGVTGLTPAEPVIGDAIAFRNGYESTRSVALAAGKFYGTQVNINNAILAAINDDPVLNKLLVAEIGANNTLVVSSKIDGTFVTEDLDISINRSAIYGSTSTTVIPSALVTEAIQLGFIQPGVVASNTTNDTPLELAPAVLTALYGEALDNDFYSGVNNSPDASSTNQFNNLWSDGSDEGNQSDHFHTPGTGNDVVVLSTDNNANDDNEYWTLDGWLFDRASNETLIFSGADFGKDTIVNFQTAGVEDYVGLNPDTTTPNVPPIIPTGEDPEGGFDFLDFTSYLTSQFTTTVDGQSVTRRISVSLEDRSLANADGATLDPAEDPDTQVGPDGLLLGESPDADSNFIDANEVYIVSLDNVAPGTSGQTFAGLTASTVAALINGNSTVVYGSLDGDELDVNRSYDNVGGQIDLVSGAAKAILLVQNADNLGEYKVFEVTWNGLASANTPNPVAATVVQVGALDFGTSLEGLDELNLVGSLEHSLFNFDVDSPI